MSERTVGSARRSTSVYHLEFAATVVGGSVTTKDADGFVGFVFEIAAEQDGTGGRLQVQRADDPEPHEEPYCVLWGNGESTTYGGVERVTVESGEVSFALTTLNAAELGTPRRFRITFAPERTEEVRDGLRRTLGPEVVW